MKHDISIPGVTSQLRGGYMPQLPAIVNRWLSWKVKQSNAKNEAFAGVIQQFQKFIESDSSILHLFQQMFSQVPTAPPYDNDTREIHLFAIT
ncbi:hypothetical protein C0995_016250 [Termitomyces sp. Mi166|nr:hypothetical protein C0995_016250 [Termitomyces sp. Mi166\